jgi:hypothetical protein
MSNTTLIAEAEKAIARVLQKLEQETGHRVTAVKINDAEVTGLHSKTREFSRVVEIISEPPPGSHWAT